MSNTQPTPPLAKSDGPMPPSTPPELLAQCAEAVSAMLTEKLGGGVIHVALVAWSEHADPDAYSYVATQHAPDVLPRIALLHTALEKSK